MSHARRGPVLGTLLAIAALVVGAPAQLAAQEEGAPLSTSEVRQLIVGNTVNGPWRSRVFDFFYRADGTMGGTIQGWGADRGNWTLGDDGEFCQQWIVFFQAVRRCYRWYPNGNRWIMRNVDVYRTLDINVWKIIEGNPLGF